MKGDQEGVDRGRKGVQVGSKRLEDAEHEGIGCERKFSQSKRWRGRCLRTSRGTEVLGNKGVVDH